jgi:hypothetical protein
MHIFSHIGKLLLVAALIASLNMILVNGEIAEASLGIPFSGVTYPNPVILQALTGGSLVGNFSFNIVGVDAGSTINSFTDTVGTPCPTETVNSTPIAAAGITADVDGRAYGYVGLSNCATTSPGTYTISAKGSVNGTPVTNSSLATYTLNGPRP